MTTSQFDTTALIHAKVPTVSPMTAFVTVAQMSIQQTKKGKWYFRIIKKIVLTSWAPYKDFETNGLYFESHLWNLWNRNLILPPLFRELPLSTPLIEPLQKLPISK